MDYSKELEFAKKLALEAGKIMVRYFRAKDIGTEWKEDGTPITIADMSINQMVIDRIKGEFPEHGVHGEELSFGVDREWVWVCDPIDGTMPFSIGLPVSTFSLALTQNGMPKLGVVYDPFIKRMYWAQTGHGAFLNDKQIKVSNQTIKNAYIGDDSWASGTVAHDSKILPLPGLRYRLLDAGAKPLTPSSAVIMCALVASGEIAGEIFGATKPEDIAAIKVIVEEAGGKVTDLQGNNQRYDQSINGAVVSNRIIHKQLMEIVKLCES